MKNPKVLGIAAIILIFGCPESPAAIGHEDCPAVSASASAHATRELMALAAQHRMYQTKTALLQRPNRRTETYRQAHHKPKPIIAKEQAADPFANVSQKQPTVRTPAQTVGLNFTAETVTNVQDPFIIPPNLNGWVGPNQYILMTYENIRSFNKTTGLPDGMLDIDAASFFGVPANDVRIEYDRFYQRWLMSCEGIDPTTGQVANLVLAISSDSVITPSTIWYFFTITNAQVIPQIVPLGSGDLDYQQLAVDKNNIYISVDTFDQNGNFLGSSVIVISKSSITPSSLSFNSFYGVLPTSGFLAPADNFDTNPSFGYLINASNYEYPSDNIYRQLFFYRINNPGKDSQTLAPLLTLTVPSYADPANAPYQGNPFGTTAFLQTSGSSLMAGHVRGHQLYLCHTIQVNVNGTGNPNGDRTGVRWYQFDLTGDGTGRARGNEKAGTLPALVQWGTLYDSSPTNPLFY